MKQGLRCRRHQSPAQRVLKAARRTKEAVRNCPAPIYDAGGSDGQRDVFLCCDECDTFTSQTFCSSCCHEVRDVEEDEGT